MGGPGGALHLSARAPRAPASHRAAGPPCRPPPPACFRTRERGKSASAGDSLHGPGGTLVTSDTQVAAPRPQARRYRARAWNMKCCLCGSFTATALPRRDVDADDSFGHTASRRFFSRDHWQFSPTPTAAGRTCRPNPRPRAPPRTRIEADTSGETPKRAAADVSEARAITRAPENSSHLEHQERPLPVCAEVPALDGEAEVEHCPREIAPEPRLVRRADLDLRAVPICSWRDRDEPLVHLGSRSSGGGLGEVAEERLPQTTTSDHHRARRGSRSPLCTDLSLRVVFLISPRARKEAPLTRCCR